MVNAIFLLYLLLAPGAVSDIPPGDLIRKGDMLYVDFDIDHKNLNRAIELYKKAADSGNREVAYNSYWRMTNAYLALGNLSQNAKQKMTYYENARDAALLAVEENPDRVEAHFWYFASLGKMCESDGLIGSLLTASKMKKHIDRALEIDPEYTLAVYGKGVLLAKLPYFLGGDKQQSEEMFKKAIIMDPYFSPSYLRLSEMYMKNDRIADARVVLEKVIQMEKHTWKANWNAILKPKAKRYLDSLNEITGLRAR